tara:strand:- start:100 stop:276 length:177 start_codon:yes stop_codon:yes gene_type:complete
MSSEEWVFEEHERDDVCLGKMCPRCRSTDIVVITFNPTPYALNFGYDCIKCGEMWEGY